MKSQMTPAGPAVLVVVVLLANEPALAQELVFPKPDENTIFNVESATPEECSHLGLRFLGKKILDKIEKNHACRCVRCGWKYFPPKRLCWRVC
jgi:hypothetical protein